MAREDRAKNLIRAIYSAAAERVYEPVVVNGAFKLFGGNLNELALAQGRRAVEAATGGVILDMPVGTAYFTVPLARAHPGLVVGSDIAEGMVDSAQKASRETGTSNLVLVQADAHHLPFQDGAFPVAMCTNGLQVIPDGPRALRELERVLAPGGKLFVSVLTLPVGAMLPPEAQNKLPTVLRSSEDVADLVAATGLVVETVRRERLATLIEASKP